MPSFGAVQFNGKSGQEYRFKVYPMATRFRKIGGLYLIAVRAPGTNGVHRLTVLYVGGTEDLSQPLKKHPKAEEFARRGANCVCLQSDGSRDSRRQKRRDLIAAFKPACNNKG